MDGKAKKLFLPGKFKTLFFAVLYFVVSLLLLHDVFVLIAHSIDPEFLQSAEPYILNKFLSIIIASLGV